MLAHLKTPLNHSAVLVWNIDLASTRSNDHGNHEELDVVQKQVGGFMRKLEVVHMEVGGCLKSNLNLKSKYLLSILMNSNICVGCFERSFRLVHKTFDV